MQDTNENRVAHLTMIQNVISRMASNSFLVKGWSVTLISALIAVGIVNQKTALAYLALGPALVFWGLDAYWLRQERLFRALYDSTRTASPNLPNDQMFSMDTEPFSRETSQWLATLFKPTVLALHIGIVAAVVIVATLMIDNGGG